MSLIIDESMFGKPLKVSGTIVLEDASEDDEAVETEVGTDTDTNTEEQNTEEQNTETQSSDSQEEQNTDEQQETPETDAVDTGSVDDAENDGNTEVIGYAKLRTMMNIRDKNSLDSEIVTIYKKDTIVPILQYCSNSWARIVCEEADCGYAYVCNTDNVYLIIGKSIYTVEKGDTIKSIAAALLEDEERYTEIKTLNEFSSNVIAEGQVLLIPEV
ncbi:MAG: LysM peptidoglycan-binding domain-containing protein [Lachnospiraceae bacterium]|nr:LysM peptidoglycan-binding domain-containing protein [Lachnospiraceae bacterium]